MGLLLLALLLLPCCWCCCSTETTVVEATDGDGDGAAAANVCGGDCCWACAMWPCGEAFKTDSGADYGFFLGEDFSCGDAIVWRAILWNRAVYMWRKYNGQNKKIMKELKWLVNLKRLNEWIIGKAEKSSQFSGYFSKFEDISQIWKTFSYLYRDSINGTFNNFPIFFKQLFKSHMQRLYTEINNELLSTLPPSKTLVWKQNAIRKTYGNLYRT